MYKKDIKKIQYNRHGTIDCMINHKEFGWIPFTVVEGDCEELGKELYAEIMSGKHGKIAEYVAPEITAEEKTTEVMHKRRALLTEVDVVASNPLRWEDLSEQEQEELRQYRRAVFSIKEQDGFPFNVIWPDSPKALEL